MNTTLKETFRVILTVGIIALCVLIFGFLLPLSAHAAYSVLVDNTTAGLPSTANQISAQLILSYDAGSAPNGLHDGSYVLGSMRALPAYIGATSGNTQYYYLKNDGSGGSHGTGAYDCRSQDFTPAGVGGIPWGNTGSATGVSDTVFVFTGTECDFTQVDGVTSMQIGRSGSTGDIYMLANANGDPQAYAIAYTGTYNPIEPPTSDFNTVANYLPSAGFSTTTGTTTVGATFSITAPADISYFGYRIYDPSGAVVYNATSTTADAGSFTISHAFNFTQSGNYQGHAYFAQDVGGNIWEVDYTVIQQILVDVTAWTVDNNGTFTQNPATTSTTTVSSLTLDCGTGFTGSICNLVARLFIPSSAGFSLVQSAFSSLMAKAPFSFFTESRNILAAVGTAGTPTGGSLVMTLYGQTVPIISTSTAAAVGLGTTQLDFLKFIMIVGLWIGLAWYIYWRIASIFGV